MLIFFWLAMVISLQSIIACMQVSMFLDKYLRICVAAFWPAASLLTHSGLL